mmetsp:Transcript_27937/g.37133  ORF Transcript_27937/g.37133 Transcript_27937/m.37133 type:complete len:96 (+) Transcript_27937:817-1104(+)
MLTLDLFALCYVLEKEVCKAISSKLMRGIIRKNKQSMTHLKKIKIKKQKQNVCAMNTNKKEEQVTIITQLLYSDLAHKRNASLSCLVKRLFQIVL